MFEKLTIEHEIDKKDKLYLVIQIFLQNEKCIKCNFTPYLGFKMIDKATLQVQLFMKIDFWKNRILKIYII